MTIYYNFYCKLSCSSDINNLYDSLYLFFMNWPSNSSSLELGWPDTAGSWQLAVMQLWLPDCIFSKLGWAGLGGGERGNFLGVIIVSPPGYSPNIRAAKISQSEKDWLCSSSSYPALNWTQRAKWIMHWIYLSTYCHPATIGIRKENICSSICLM